LVEIVRARPPVPSDADRARRVVRFRRGAPNDNIKDETLRRNVTAFFFFVKNSFFIRIEVGRRSLKKN